jgi:hypothetical protein
VGPGRFDRLFAEGRQVLLSGTHQVQSVPVDNGPRWGISAVLRPDPLAAQAIEQVARAAAAVVGGSPWLAGSAASSHLTLRGGLQRHRTDVPAGDPLVARYAAALRTAARVTAVRGIDPIRFAVTEHGDTAWYHIDVAMTLRLSDEQTEALRRKAEAEHRSMQQVALAAIDAYVHQVAPARRRSVPVAELMTLFQDLPPMSAEAFRADQERYADTEARFDAYERAQQVEDSE